MIYKCNYFTSQPFEVMFLMRLYFNVNIIYISKFNNYRLHETESKDYLELRRLARKILSL